MKQVHNIDGSKIHGLYRQEDGSLVVIDHPALQKNIVSHSAFMALNKEVETLKAQMIIILEKLNG